MTKEKIKEIYKKLLSNRKAKIIIAITLIAVVVIVGVFFYQHSKNSIYEDSVAIHGMSDKEIQEAVNKDVEDGQINIHYSLNANFKGKDSTKFLVRNIEANHGDLIFSIYDEKDNELYTSKVLKRGHQVEHITLNKELPKGSHEGKIQIGYAEAGNVASVFPIILQFS